MTPGSIVLLKAVYTALLGALVTPLFGLRALADADPAASADVT